MIANKYNIIEKIGSGTFGSIYKGQNIRTGEDVAIKVEPLQNGTNLLKNEARIYQYLKGGIGIPQVKWFGVDDTNNYMVINLLGESLQAYKNAHGAFSLADIMFTGAQMIERIKHVHESGLIHRDIKPDNFLFGINEHREKIYIIDFGFCKQSNASTKATPATMTSIIGTPNYISINVHNHIEPDKHDDMESILYTLMYLLYDKLPWDIPNITNTRIRDMKQAILYGPANITLPKLFTQFVSILSKGRENDTPRYDLFLKLFTGVH